jgi:hypothetical protein
MRWLMVRALHISSNSSMTARTINHLILLAAVTGNLGHPS